MNHNNIEYNISNHQNFKRRGYKITCKPMDFLWKIIPLPESWLSPPPRVNCKHFFFLIAKFEFRVTVLYDLWGKIHLVVTTETVTHTHTHTNSPMTHKQEPFPSLNTTQRSPWLTSGQLTAFCTFLPDMMSFIAFIHLCCCSESSHVKYH